MSNLNETLTEIRSKISELKTRIEVENAEYKTANDLAESKRVIIDNITKELSNLEITEKAITDSITM